MERWFGVDVFLSFLSLLASSEWNFTTWTPDRLLSCCKRARSQAVHVQPVCMHPCKRAVAPVAVSPDPRRPTCSHHSLSLGDPVTPGRSWARSLLPGICQRRQENVYFRTSFDQPESVSSNELTLIRVDQFRLHRQSLKRRVGV